MTPYPGQIVVKRAESKLGTNDYNPLKWNCEHFATWCRYGKAVSKQVPFSKGLSNNAYLVQLPGIEVIPHGSLPEDIGIKGNIAVGHFIGAEGIPPERLAENMADVGNTVLRLALGIPPINQPGCAIM
ncbi:uncharacterized protein LOC128549517 [Mercenaria mercenaria]|uniref:uncharacterized protein LOC128549517 n=1 Tax=Mercenaria mercenaria TaxID=6596 RepID=UPI00234EDA31|nr:uncharacterized protein LOC128549517 [Mercenaria mercenaria]